MNKFLLITLILSFTVSCNNRKIPNKKYPRTNEVGEIVLDITYCNYTTNEYIEKDCTMEEAVNYFYQLSKDTESFLTIGFSPTQAIQFVWDKKGLCLAEITNDGDERIYMQCYASTEACIDMIITTYTGDPNKLEGFLPVPIMEKTLDDVLQEREKWHHS